MTEPNPIWTPIQPKPQPLWLSPLEMAEAYRRAEPRINRSQRYGLTVTAPLPEPTWRKL